MFKVNNKDTGATSSTSFLFVIFNFEQISHIFLRFDGWFWASKWHLGNFEDIQLINPVSLSSSTGFYFLFFWKFFPLGCMYRDVDEILVFYQNLRSIWLLFSIIFLLLVILYIIIVLILFLLDPPTNRGLMHGCLPVCSCICDALRDLVLFVQFKKREKHPWRNVNFSKVAGWSLLLLLVLLKRMTEFFNQQYLQNGLTDRFDIVLVDRNSEKIETKTTFLVG